VKIHFRKVSGVLVPLYDQDVLAFQKIAGGDVVYKDFKKIRNPYFHRKGFALLNLIFENQDQFDDFEEFRRWMKVKCGVYKEYIINGRAIIEVGSMSFAKMDDYEFGQVYSRIINVALKYCVPRTWSYEEADRLVNQILQFA